MKLAPTDYMHVFAKIRASRTKIKALLRNWLLWIVALCRKRSLLFFIVPLTLAYFWPLVFSPLIGDDVYRANIGAYAQEHRVSLAHAIDLATQLSAREHGGWFPAARMTFVLWTLVPTVPFAKTLQLSLVTLNVCTFVYVAYLASRSLATAWLAFALLCTCVEFRKPHDPILSSLFSWPLSAQCILIAFAGWFVFRDGGRLRYVALAIALTAYGCAALLDETAYPLAFAFLPLAYRSGRNTYFAASAFVVIPLAAVLATACLHVPQALSFARVGDEIVRGGEFIRAGTAQAFAALPATFRGATGVIGDGPSTWSGDRRFENVPSPWIRWVFAAVFGTIVATSLASRARRWPQERLDRSCLIAGAGLWLLPTILGVGSPAQWRGGVPLGEAFDSVYISYFGIALFLAAACNLVITEILRRKLRWQRIFIVCVTLYVFYTSYGNVRYDAYIVRLDILKAAPVADLRRALGSGLMALLGDSPKLVLADAYGLENSSNTYRSATTFVFARTKMRLSVLTHRAVLAGGELCKVPQTDRCDAKTSAWYVWSPIGKRTETVPAVQFGHWTSSTREGLLGNAAYGFYPFDSISHRRAITLLQLASPSNGPVGTYNTNRTDLVAGVHLRCGVLPLEAILGPRVQLPQCHANAGRE